MNTLSIPPSTKVQKHRNGKAVLCFVSLQAFGVVWGGL